MPRGYAPPPLPAGDAKRLPPSQTSRDVWRDLPGLDYADSGLFDAISPSPLGTV